jgi:hypothetical protein
VQAGFLLAEHLPTTPDVRRHRLDREVLDLMRAKADVSQLLHANSKVKVGGQSLVQFLAPSNFAHRKGSEAFLRQLSVSRPWVLAGHPEKSRLITEMSWNGRMFGAFTISEKVRFLIASWLS